MLVAGERMADQNGVRGLFIQRTIGLVGQSEGAERYAPIKLKRFIFREMHEP